MKNRVFRFTIAIVLTVAMMLTIVGCSSNAPQEPTPTQTPAVSVLPTLVPVVTPTFTTPTPAPTPTPDPQVVLAENFKLSVVGEDGVFGTDHKNADDEELAPGYFQVEWSDELLTKQDYSLDLAIDITSEKYDYEFEISIPAGNASSALPTALVGSSTLNFASSEGYIDAYQQTVDGVEVLIYQGKMLILFENADEYEITVDGTLQDVAFDFGGWNNDDREEYDFSLESKMTVEKKPVTIEILPAVIEECECELQALSSDNNNDAYETSISQDGTKNSIYFPATFSVGDKGITLKYEMDYVKEGAIGNYPVAIAEEYILDGVTYDDIDDLNEKFTNYEIINVMDTAVYVVSSYDYTEIADVLTSVAEICYEITPMYTAVMTPPTTNDPETILASGFFSAMTNNIAVQLPLALARYEALSAEQRAFFDTNMSVAAFDNVTHDNVNYFFNSVNGTSLNDDFDYSYNPETEDAHAGAFLEYMNFASEAYQDYLIYTAFDEYAEEVELPKTENDYVLMALATPDSVVVFNVENSDNMKSYNLVDGYFNALSDEQQEVIENDNSAWYRSYLNAKEEILFAEIDSVQQLIAGAFAAYIKAIPNNTVIYKDVVGDDIADIWTYIQDEEVISLTEQALAGYNALSDKGQEYLEDNLYQNSAMDGQIFDLAGYVDFKDGKNTSYNALEKLVAMNEMIETMVKISQYVNIEDYSTKTVPYERLKTLVFGSEYTVGDSTTLGGLYFPEYTTGTGDTISKDYRFAMQDIINAPTRNYDAIIDEYQQWMTYVVKIEEYKTTALMEFVTQIKFEVSALSEDDYSQFVLSNAGDGENMVAVLIIDAIMSENISAFVASVYPGNTSVTGALAPTVFESDAVILKDSDIEPFLGENFLVNRDNFEDIQDTFEDFMDLEDIVDAYVDAIKELD